MIDLTPGEVVVAIVGSGGLIAGSISLFSFITGRLDVRRKRLKETLAKEISQTADMKRFDLDATNLVHNQLWEIIKERDVKITALEGEIEVLDEKAILQRPTILKVYANLRAMRKEIESLNLMILNEEETNVFMRRFQTVKVLLDETEAMLP